MSVLIQSAGMEFDGISFSDLLLYYRRICDHMCIMFLNV